MMQSTSLINYSSPIIFHPFSKPCSSTYYGRKATSFVPIKASSSRKEAADHHHHHQNFGGRLVDEGMIVLRKRIHEMNMIERNYEPPSDWMDWEKSYYTSYDSIICEAMAVLQTQLMNTRPSLALAVMALIFISVPTSTALLLFQLFDFTKALLSGIHIS